VGEEEGGWGEGGEGEGACAWGRRAGRCVSPQGDSGQAACARAGRGRQVRLRVLVRVCVRVGWGFVRMLAFSYATFGSAEMNEEKRTRKTPHITAGGAAVAAPAGGGGVGVSGGGGVEGRG
jgi:hypothetical protein